MVQAALRLLGHAIELTVGSMGTTLLALIVGLLIFGIRVWRDPRQRETLRAMKRREIFSNMAIVLGPWLLLFGYYTLRAIYEDHTSLVAMNAKSSKRFEDLERANAASLPVLSSESMRVLRSMLESPTPGGHQVQIWVPSSNAVAIKFADRLAEAFSAARWGRSGSLHGNNPRPVGHVNIFSDYSDPEAVHLVMTAFNELDIPYAMYRVCDGTSLRLEVGDRSPTP
jgi:hypothetical protein